MRRPLVVSWFVLLLAATPAWAQQAAAPGQFDYYLLALSWSPQYCAEHADDAAARGQCRQSFGFVAHGLWPQDNGGGYPTACRPAGRVPHRVAEQVLPIMPSQRLVDHEWAVHGTCSGLAIDDYFDALGRAFRKVQIPTPLDRPHLTVTASVKRIKQLFAEANPGLGESMMTVHCSGRDRAVSEIHVCLTKSLDFRPCGTDQADSCRRGEGRFRAVP